MSDFTWVQANAHLYIVVLTKHYDYDGESHAPVFASDSLGEVRAWIDAKPPKALAPEMLEEDVWYDVTVNMDHPRAA